MKMVNIGGYDHGNPNYKINQVPTSPELREKALKRDDGGSHGGEEE